MVIILTMKLQGDKHTRQHEHALCSSPEKTFIVNSHTGKKKKPKKKNLHTFACMLFTTRQTHICTAVTHISEQESKHTPFTVDFVVPRRISHVPKTKYLQTYFIFISILILHSVCLYQSVQRRACASACMYFVGAAC